MRSIFTIATMVTLAGCSAAGLNNPDNRVSRTPVTVAEIQRAVACEFNYALRHSDGAGRQALLGWSAVVELTLAAKDTHNITPGLGQMSAKVGNATIATGSPAPSMTFDGYVEDKNTLAYVARIEDQARGSTCPVEGSALASTGLELADLLVGTAQVISSGGRITSSNSIITNAGIGPVDGALVSAGTVLPVATVAEDIPTVKYERWFTVSRKAGGGLSFKVGSVSLSLTGSAIGRERKDNKIVVTMGASRGKLSPSQMADLADFPTSGAVDGEISLEDSILIQRRRQLDALRGLTPNEVIVVVPPAAP